MKVYFVLVCDVLHTPHMYFRLQPVFSVSLCSVGFAIVDAIFGQVCFTKMAINRAFLQL